SLSLFLSLYLPPLSISYLTSFFLFYNLIFLKRKFILFSLFSFSFSFSQFFCKVILYFSSFFPSLSFLLSQFLSLFLPNLFSLLLVLLIFSLSTLLRVYIFKYK